MSFVDTFGDIVGYSIYFVVGGIWLLFLSVGVCFVSFHIFYFCSKFQFWGVWSGKVVETLCISFKLVKNGLAKLAEVPVSLKAFVRRATTCRKNSRQAPDIAMAEAGTRNSLETPLLHEHDSFSDDETLAESKIDIVVGSPSQNSIELPQIPRNDGSSQDTGPDC